MLDNKKELKTAPLQRSLMVHVRMCGSVINTCVYSTT